jgi:glycosyltransferase involved in cell wall biosynthesis
MNILIDFSQIPKKKVGVGVYALNLIRQLALLDQRNHYVVLIQDDDDCLDGIWGTNFHKFKLNHRIFRYFLFRVVLEQILIPILIQLRRIDVVHSLHYSFPFVRSRARIVVTIHDMTFFLYPKYHLRSKIIYFRFFIKQLARRADAVIAVSESTKRDFVRLMGASPKKVTVIPLGRPPAEDRSLAQSTNPEEVFAKFGIRRPYLLYVGTMEPRKNIQRLIRTFGCLYNHWPQGQLVIAGTKGWDYKPIFESVCKLRLQQRVAFLGYISDIEKYCLMTHAVGFVYPSLYEGFGLPVLEAMSLGTPTLTSNRSSLPEVARQAALLINPEDETQLLAGLLTFITEPDFCAILSRRAKARSNFFRWRYTAQATLNLYNTLYSQRNSSFS